jgi:hypothetical protein
MHIAGTGKLLALELFSLERGGGGCGLGHGSLTVD